MEKEEEEKKGNKKDIQKDTLEPVTKVNTKLDKELQEWRLIQLPVAEKYSPSIGWNAF